MKKISISIFLILFQITLFAQNEIICAEVFQAIVATEFNISDQGDMDQSYIKKIESEDFSKHWREAIIDRDRNQGSAGGGFNLFEIIKVDFPTLTNKSDKQTTDRALDEFRQRWKSEINQSNKKSWLKNFASRYLPADARKDILESWDKCIDGSFDLAKHKENVKVELAKIGSDTEITLAKTNSLTSIEIQKLYNEDKISERTYKLELARIDASKKGLIYEIDEKDNSTIDIILRWNVPISGPDEIEITLIDVKGATYNKKSLFEGVKFERNKRIRFEKISETVSIILETNIEVTIEYYKKSEKILVVDNQIEIIKVTESGEEKKYARNGMLLAEGEFVNGKLSGQGVKYTKNESTFNFVHKSVGTFQNGQLNGYGEVFKNGKQHHIHFNNGKLITSGNFKNGLLQGQGTKIVGSWKMVGDFDQGKFTGNGEKFLYGVLLSKGSYLDGNLNGQGTYYFDENVIWSTGTFKNDVLISGKKFNKTIVNFIVYEEGEFKYFPEKPGKYAYSIIWNGYIYYDSIKRYKVTNGVQDEL